MKAKKIKFFTLTQDVQDRVDAPKPAVEMVPKWFTSLPKFVGGKMRVGDDGSVNTGVKGCTSFMDTLTSGYIVTLHCDILVEIIDGNQRLSWSSTERPLTARAKEVADHLPTPAGYGQFLQAWELKYAFKVPEGYSVLVTQPFNRYDLPTLATTGIIDADDWIGPGGIPFALKEDYSGIIKAGTPIIQLFPFKRDDWESENIGVKFSPAWNGRARNRLYGWYRDTIWKKKSFK